MKKALWLLVLTLLLPAAVRPAWSKNIPVWWPTAAAEARREGFALTTPEEVQRLITSGGRFLLLDVRPDYEYKAGHIAAAKNFEIDLGDRFGLKPQKADEFKKVLGADKSRLIVIYCRSFR